MFRVLRIISARKKSHVSLVAHLCVSIRCVICSFGDVLFNLGCLVFCGLMTVGGGTPLWS